MINVYIKTIEDGYLFRLGEFTISNAMSVVLLAKERGFTYDKGGDGEDVYTFAGYTLGSTPAHTTNAGLYILMKPSKTAETGDDAE